MSLAVAQPRPSAEPSDLLVVGFGAAGLAVVETLRRANWPGSITVLAEEEELPYDRPTLSKKYLDGSHGLDKIALTDPERLADLGVTLLNGTLARQVDLERRVVLDSAGVERSFRQLVIASGVRPRQIPGTELPGVYTLRNRSDSDALRERLVPASRLVVIGAGFLGLEVAATARTLGATVTVVDPAARPLADRLGARIASRILQTHASRGVEVLSGVGVKQLRASTERVQDSTPSTAELEVVLSDDQILSADVVLVAVGAVPNIEWLQGSTIDLSNGVRCDEFCAVAPGVWAVGDVARWLHPAVGREVRLEHRMNAGEQGRAVAQNIMAQELLSQPKPFAPVPFFWTDHFEHRIQVAGFLPSGAELESPSQLDGDPEGAFIVSYRDVTGRLTAVAGIDSVKAMMPYRRELARNYAESLAEFTAPESFLAEAEL